jgi:LmbE family N-acetylglucosaminyl deacetylase
VFTESDASQSALYRSRRSEDRRAARLLGATTAHLGFLDAPFRSSRYGNFCGIVFGRANEYPRTLDQVSEKIGQLIRRLRPEQILAPLAVGNHVDHRLVRDAALMAVDRSRLLFYEDRPYAFVRGQVSHVIATPASPLHAEYFAATYVRRHLGRTRQDSVAAKWAHVRPLPCNLRRARCVQMDSAELQMALQAIRAYRTQIGDLFSSEEELVSQYRSHLETLWEAGSDRRGRRTPVSS